MPARIPTAQKEARGSLKRADVRAKHNFDEPKLPVSAPPRPPGLRPAVAEQWDWLVQALHVMGVLTTVDAQVVRRAAECIAEVADLQADVDDNGRIDIVESKHGTYRKPRPEVAMLADADRRLKGYLIELGLTPAARTRVKANTAPPSDDPAEGYFQ